jgi:uncharacterized DUF497 family protein
VAKFRVAQWLWDWLSALRQFPFEWDAANSIKSLQKHGATCAEAEEAFTEGRFIPLGEQYEPSLAEPRYGLLGESARGKLLFAVFTLRDQRIRVVSARAMNEKERRFYVALRQE